MTARAAKRFTAADYHATAAEKDIQAGICALLDLVGIVYSVTDASRTWAKGGGVRKSKVAEGWPDMSCVLPVGIWVPTEINVRRLILQGRAPDSSELEPSRFGRAWFIETKTAVGRLKPAQLVCHERLRAAGALVTIARSIEDIQRVLRAEGYRI